MARSGPLVSIVTPVFNTAEHLPECIESVLRQSHGDFEYLIVDNRSTDGSGLIARRYAERDERIRVIDADRFRAQVPNYDFALGLISAESRYCKIVQADDWLFPACLERMVRLAETDEQIRVVGAYHLAGSHVKCQGLPAPPADRDWSVVPGPGACRLFLRDRRYLFGSPTTVLFRSEDVRARERFFGSVSHDPDPMHSDSEVCFELLRDGRFGFVHQVLSHTRSSPDSRSGTAGSYHPDLLHAYLIHRKHGEFFLDPEEHRARLEEVEREIYRHLALNVFKGRDREFWEFYRDGLGMAGHELSMARVMALQVPRFARRLGNPFDTLASTLSRIRSRRVRSRRPPSAEPVVSSAGGLAPRGPDEQGTGQLPKEVRRA